MKKAKLLSFNYPTIFKLFSYRWSLTNDNRRQRAGKVNADCNANKSGGPLEQWAACY